LKTICRVSLVFLLCFWAGLTLSEPLQAQPPKVYGTAQAAVRVIGQPNFTSDNPGFDNTSLGAPTSMTIAGQMLIVADGGNDFLGPQNSRVLIYPNYATANQNASASVVLGQTGFGSTCNVAVGQFDSGIQAIVAATAQPCQLTGTAQNMMTLPQGVSSDGVRLAVADTGNSRILIFNSIPTTNGANADLVLGQPNFTSSLPGTTQNTMRSPNGVTFALGKLFVADTYNHRVLIFNSVPTSSNANADIVLGQPNFTSHTCLATPSASSMCDPTSVTTDGTRLIVTDLGNNRVLIFNQIPTTNGAAADVVVGEPDFATNDINATNNTTDPSPSSCCSGSSSLQFPRDAFSDGQRLIISDSGNNRILVYNTMPTVNGAFPDAIIGQYDPIGHLEGLTAEKLANPMGLMPLPYGGFLVADGNNRRFLEFQPGQPWVNKGYIFDAASLNSNGLPKPVNVQATVSVDNTGTVPPGNYFARVTATYSSYPRESAPSDEIPIVVPAADTTGATVLVTWNVVNLLNNAATPVPADSYRVYFGRLQNLEDRFAGADLAFATATPLVIGGTPAAGDVISITITNDDATTFTVNYTVVSGDTVGSIGDNIANDINTNSANDAGGVTATSDHKGTVTWQAKQSGSVGNSCVYLAQITSGTGTTVTPNDSAAQFTGANANTTLPQLTLATYPVDPTIAGSFGNQHPLDNMVPGEILMIQGQFANSVTAAATTAPLPYSLAGTTVWANGQQCPIVSVSPTQILFQIPTELSGDSAGIWVQQTLANGNTANSIAMPVTLTLPQPSIYSADGTGTGAILALHADGTTVTSLSPASENELITFYGTGFGLLADYPQNVASSLITTSGELVVGSYYMRVTAIYADGTESLGSGEVLQSISSGNTNSAAVTWNPTPGAVKYRVYVGTASLEYNRYFETDTNSYILTNLIGQGGVPPAETNVPGNGVIGVATTQQVQVQSNVCPTVFMGPNTGVVGVWRVACTIPNTISAADLLIGPYDTFGLAEVHAIVGAIDSNHVYLPVRRPAPTTFTITPSVLSFTGIAGSVATPVQEPVTINKLGGGNLTWSANINTTDGGTWLTASTLSGTNTSTITIAANPSSLTPGTYYGTVTITGDDGSGNPVLDANGNPLIATTNVLFYVTATGAPPQHRRDPRVPR
jgi:uncharacterized protein (TIGR03437 family)